MQKLLLTVLSLFMFSSLYSQEDILLFKKGNKTIDRFWKGTFIAFQLENKTWEKGELMRIKDDSFYIRPRVIKYGLYGTDTFYYPIKAFILSDIYAMPKRGVLIDFVNGQFQISRTGGHQHFYWIKSGLLFKLGGAGYAILSIVNGIPGGVAIGAALFAVGIVMKKTYKLTYRLNRKYHFEVLPSPKGSVRKPV